MQILDQIGDPASSDWILIQPVDEHDEGMMPEEIRYIREMPIRTANIIPSQLQRLLPARKSAVIAEKAAVVCPEGKLLSLSECCPITIHSSWNMLPSLV